MRNYDAWVTRTPPWSDAPEPWEMQGHCVACGAWLPLQPYAISEKVLLGHCSGIDPVMGISECDTWGSDVGKCPNKPHNFTVYNGTDLLFRCRHCGCENVREEF